MLSTHEDAVRRESNCLIIYANDALDDFRVWRTQVGYLLCADVVPLLRAVGIWSLRARCWYRKPETSVLAEITDMTGTKDLMCHIWHLQLIYDKRQSLGKQAEKWSRQQYLDYVLRAMQDADVTASMFENMQKSMPDSQKGYVSLEQNPNDRDLGEPEDEDSQCIKIMKQALFEIQMRAMKKYIKKKHGGVDTSESEATATEDDKQLDFGMKHKIAAKNMPRPATPPTPGAASAAGAAPKKKTWQRKKKEETSESEAEPAASSSSRPSGSASAKTKSKTTNKAPAPKRETSQQAKNLFKDAEAAKNVYVQWTQEFANIEWFAHPGEKIPCTNADDVCGCQDAMFWCRQDFVFNAVGGKLFMKFLNEGVEEYKASDDQGGIERHADLCLKNGCIGMVVHSHADISAPALACFLRGSHDAGSWLELLGHHQCLTKNKQSGKEFWSFHGAIFRCVFGKNTSGNMIDPSTGIRTQAPDSSDWTGKPEIQEFESLGSTKDLSNDECILVLHGQPDTDDMLVPAYKTGVTNRDVFRLGLSEVRIAVFHLSSFGWRSAWQEGCDNWLRFITAAIAAQVDFITGDGNLFAQRNFKMDQHTDYKSSILIDLLERLLAEINPYRSGMNQITYNLCSSIQAGAYIRAMSGDTNVTNADCMIMISLSYGKQSQVSLSRTASTKATAEGVVGSGFSDEVMLQDVERPKYLQNIDLGLIDSDQAAHSPLIAIAKLYCQRNLRVRTEGSDLRRRGRRGQRQPRYAQRAQDDDEEEEIEVETEEENEPVGRLRSTTPSSGARLHGQEDQAKAGGRYENPNRRIPVTPPKTPPAPPSRRRERSVGKPRRERADLHDGVRTVWLRGKGRERKGKEGKGRERKGMEGKGRERKGKKGKGMERKGKEGKGRKRSGKEGEGTERKGKEGKGRERKGKEGKGRERKGKEGKGGCKGVGGNGLGEGPLGMSEFGCVDGCGRRGCKGVGGNERGEGATADERAWMRGRLRTAWLQGKMHLPSQLQLTWTWLTPKTAPRVLLASGLYQSASMKPPMSLPVSEASD
eukprot:s2064_g5.t1